MPEPVAVAEPMDSWDQGPVDIPHRAPTWNDPWNPSAGPAQQNDYYYGDDYYYDYSSATCATFAASMLFILAQ